MTSRLKIFFLKRQIRYLLRRLGPSTYSMSGEEARKNDYVHIIVSLESDSEGVVIGIENNHLRIQVYADDNPEVLIPISDINFNVKSVSHDYRGWALRYPSLFQAILRIFFRYPLFNHYWQVIFNLRFNFLEGRYKVLSRIVKLTKFDQTKTITSWQLVENLKGKRALNAYNANYLNYINLILGSFDESEELEVDKTSYTNLQFKLKPKAVKTLAQYKIEVRRHRTMVAIFILQALAALVLVLITWSNRVIAP